MPPSCPGPLGKVYLGGVGAGCCSKVHPYPPPRCPRSRGTGNPGPTPSPSAPGQGTGPAARACGLGPSALARVTARGRGGREQSVTRRPPPPPHPLFPPTSTTPAPPPQPPRRGTRTTRAELSSTLLGGSPEAGTPTGDPPPPDERQRRPRGLSGAGVGRGEAGLDRAGCDGGGGRRVRVAAARAGGGGGEGEAAGREALGDTRSLGGGGHLFAPGEGPVPRQGSSPKAIYPPGQLAFSRGAAGRGGVEARALRGAASRNLGAAGLPPGRGSGHVCRGASEQSARGRTPGIVGDQARDGSRGEPDSGPGWSGGGGGLAPCSGGRGRVGSSGQGAVRGSGEA